MKNSEFMRPAPSYRQFFTILFLLTVLMVSSSCQNEASERTTVAQRVAARAQLVGGPTALGEVGDWILKNDQIRVVIQDIGFNRGSGIYGGSLIDADFVRNESGGDALGGKGRDSFGELFPAFFLEVIDPEEIVVINDGSDGDAAILEVRGRGGEFVTMLRFFNQAMVNSYEAKLSDLMAGNPANSDGTPLVRFATRYILEPGARHVVIENKIYNDSFTNLDFPNQQIAVALGAFLPDVDFTQFYVPTGTVLGFGALNSLFLPGIGYDLQFGLERAYQQQVPLPAFPGHLTDVVASSNKLGVNYGFATAYDPDGNFAYKHNALYGERAKPDDMLFLFYASGFGGVFTSMMPRRLAPSYCDATFSAQERCDQLLPNCDGDSLCEQRYNRCISGYDACLSSQEINPSSFSFTNYFIVGDGDVASIRDELYNIREQATQKVQLKIFDEVRPDVAPSDVSVLIYQGIEGVTDPSQSCQRDPQNDVAPRIYSQAYTNSGGYAEFNLPAGNYCIQTRGEGRPLSEMIPLTVGDKSVFKRISAHSSGHIEAMVLNEAGVPIPAKMTIVGSYTNPDNIPTREFLFNLEAGEKWRTSQFIDYPAGDSSPRHYIDKTAFGGADGRISAYVEPGTYTLYFSRGLDYEYDSREITIKPGQRITVNASIERVVQPEGYLSGDFHTHAQGSIDSGLDYNTRVLSIAAEGVDIAVSSDHNYISDYMPYIYRNKLNQWLKSVVGLELTTFEAGHFNAFPLSQDITSMNRGSLPWQDIPPQSIFDALRDLGSLGPDNTIIQVNHPRDSVMGYFSQHNVSPFEPYVDLAFNQAEGTDQLFELLATPSGPAFIETYQDQGRTRYRSTFSWDFDAIEIFNGKRMELMRHYRMPYDKDELPDHIRDQLTEEEIEALPPKGTILCDGDDLVSTGGLDDWYNFLNYSLPDGSYRPYTATGNSDSHSAGKPGDPEPGYPRNYFYVGHNDVESMTDAQLVEALKSHRNIVTNGPFIEMTVNNAQIGQTTRTNLTTVDVSLYAAAADWVGANNYQLIANGEVVHEGQITLIDNEWRETIEIPIQGDTWFVLEVSGEKNLFPVVAPAEIPEIAFDDAIGSLAGPFGFGAGIDGLSPSTTGEIRPFAFTNPIWVIYDPNNQGRTQFNPPSPPVASCQDGLYTTEPNALVTLDPDTPKIKRLSTAQIPRGHYHSHSHGDDAHHHHHHDMDDLFRRTMGESRDLRFLFDAWGNCH